MTVSKGFFYLGVLLATTSAELPDHMAGFKVSLIYYVCSGAYIFGRTERFSVVFVKFFLHLQRFSFLTL